MPEYRGVRRVKDIFKLLSDFYNHLVILRDYVYEHCVEYTKDLKVLDNLVDRARFITGKKYRDALLSEDSNSLEKARAFAGFIICCYTLHQCVYCDFLGSANLKILSSRRIYISVFYYIDELRNAFEMIV